MIQCDKCKAVQKSSLMSDKFVQFMDWHFCIECWFKIKELVKGWISL